MNKFIILILHLALSPLILSAGQSGLTTTFQPLLHPSKGEIWILPVTCHHWYANSASSPVDLINAKNIPPTDMPKQATQDLNLASICGISFSAWDQGASAPPKLTMDIEKLVIPKQYDAQRNDIIRACIECLRRCLPEAASKIPLDLRGSDKSKEWVMKIVKDFNSRDRNQPFFKSPDE